MNNLTVKRFGAELGSFPGSLLPALWRGREQYETAIQNFSEVLGKIDNLECCYSKISEIYFFRNVY